MFGINNALASCWARSAGQQAPCLGSPSRSSGPLDKPDFKMNPVSVLAPGAFRDMFKFGRRNGRAE